MSTVKKSQASEHSGLKYRARPGPGQVDAGAAPLRQSRVGAARRVELSRGYSFCDSARVGRRRRGRGGIRFGGFTPMTSAGA